MGYTVLIFEDDYTMSRSLLVNINWGRLNVDNHLTATNVPDGLTLFEKHQIDLVLCDIEVMGGTGLDLLKRSRANGYETEFLFLTNFAEFSYAQKALKLGGNDYILKTEPLEVVEEAVERAVYRIRYKHPDNQIVDSFYLSYDNSNLQESGARWKDWGRYLQDAEKIKLLEGIKSFFIEYQRNNRIDSGFLTSFQNSFVQMACTTLNIPEIRTGILFDDELLAEFNRHASESVFDFIKWLSHFVDRIIACLNEKNRSGKLVEKVKAFIQENYASEINRQDIASAVNVNSDYLSRLFNKQVGVSIPEYITAIRMERAKQLMSIDLTVGEIASEVGVNNFSYFSKIFKMHTGMSPTEYKKIENRNADI